MVVVIVIVTLHRGKSASSKGHNNMVYMAAKGAIIRHMQLREG